MCRKWLGLEATNNKGDFEVYGQVEGLICPKAPPPTPAALRRSAFDQAAVTPRTREPFGISAHGQKTEKEGTSL